MRFLPSLYKRKNGKDKGRPIMCHEGTGRKSLVTDFKRGWVAFRVNLNALEKSPPHRSSNAGPPVLSQSLYELPYSGHSVKGIVTG